MSTFKKIGFSLALILSAAFEQNAYSEQFSPEELVVEDIVCVGNVRIQCDEIKDSVTQKLNEKVREREIQNSKIRLSVSGKFETVELSLRKGSKPGKAILEVAVKESSVLFGGVSMGVVTYPYRSSGVLDVTMGTRDFLEEGKTLQGSLRLVPSLRYADKIDGAFRLDYVDPKLLDDSKYYLLGTLGFSRYRYNAQTSDSLLGTFFLNVEAGRKVKSFSSFYAGVFSVADEIIVVPYVGYGWNSEDHANFPRTGSNFRASLGYKFGNNSFPYVDLGFRKHWAIQSKSVLSLNIGGAGFMTLSDRLYTFPIYSEYPILSLRYSYDFGRNRVETQKGFIRGYIEPGVATYFKDNSIFSSNSKTISTSTDLYFTPMVKAGVGFENSLFGNVNIFFAYGTEAGR